MVLTLCFTLSVTEVEAEVLEGGSSSRLPGQCSLCGPQQTVGSSGVMKPRLALSPTPWL